MTNSHQAPPPSSAGPLPGRIARYLGDMMAFAIRMRKGAASRTARSFWLARDELLEIPLLGDRRITCASGSVWITRDHDAADYLLGPGESFWKPGSRGVVIESLRDSRLQLAEPAPSEPRAASAKLDADSRDRAFTTA